MIGVMELVCLIERMLEESRILGMQYLSGSGIRGRLGGIGGAGVAGRFREIPPELH